MKNTQKRKTVPIFFAVDDNYAPYLAVALESLKDNASDKYFYDINILIEGLSDRFKTIIGGMQEENIKITFRDVTEKVNTLCERLHLRDYYTRATYYRFFIPDMFPQYNKGLYLDCDIAITRDVAEMFITPLGSNLVGAISDEVITDIDVFGTYSEVVLGVPRNKYFNAGILVMNLREMRKMKIEEVFASLLNVKTYSVAQDQDYLNVICHGRVKMLDLLWNKTPMPYSDPDRIPYIAHYKINFKPWKYDGILYGDLFWKYAERTPFYSELLNAKNNYSDSDKKRDADQYNSLEALAKRETDEELVHCEALKNDNSAAFRIMGLESIVEDFICGNNRLVGVEAADGYL